MINKILKATERISMIFKETHSLIKGGWESSYAMWCIIWWVAWSVKLTKLNKLATEKKRHYIFRHIHKNYSTIVNRYQSSNESDYECKEYKIWVFWAQGKENMPSLVKACFNKLNENNKNVQFIDMNNVHEFVSLSPIVYDKLEKGELLFAHFSDILRNTLLAEHGGLWIDSTVWVPKEMPKIVTECTFFSPHNKADGTNWCSYAIGSNKVNSLTFSFIRDILTEVCIKEEVWPDYLFQDMVFEFAYANIPAIKKSVNNVPNNNTERFMLFALMNKAYDEEYYKQLISRNFIFKLSYKATYKTNCGELPTFYAKLIGNS